MNMQVIVSRILCSPSHTCTIYVEENPPKHSSIDCISSILNSMGEKYKVKKIISFNNTTCFRTNLPYEFSSYFKETLKAQSQR